MYLVDFFKRMTRKSNIPVLIYLVLNIFVITGLFTLFFGAELSFWICFLVSIVLYAVSLVVALSPIGEWILRLQTGCKKITDPEVLNYIDPIFREVYAKAKSLDPTIHDDVRLYISDDDEPNAFATGRKTVCITKGLLQMPVEQIKATLGHEFGHLAHKDTDLILVVSVGNMIVSGFILFIRLMITLVHLVLSIASIFAGGSEGALGLALSAFYKFMITLIVSGLVWLWTKIGVLLVMKSSRANEFEADEFSFRLGYGSDLCVLLDTICGSNTKGLFANLASSHPDKADRISRIQQLMATTAPAITSGTYTAPAAITQNAAPAQVQYTQPAAQYTQPAPSRYVPNNSYAQPAAAMGFAANTAPAQPQYYQQPAAPFNGQNNQ